MKQNKKYIIMDANRKQIPLKPKTFIINSTELKFMFPWALYDDVPYKSINPKTQNNRSNFNTTEGKIKNIQIDNHKSELDYFT